MPDHPIYMEMVGPHMEENGIRNPLTLVLASYIGWSLAFGKGSHKLRRKYVQTWKEGGGLGPLAAEMHPGHGEGESRRARDH